MHKLKVYLDSIPTIARFAEAVGVDLSTVSRWRSGVRVPSPELAARIEEVTHGAVTAEDVRPDVFGGYVRRKASAPCEAS